jgi:hypothetical protein
MKEVKKRLGESSPGDVEAFEKGAQAFAKKIVTNFKDYEFVSVTLHFGVSPCLIMHDLLVCSIPENL